MALKQSIRNYIQQAMNAADDMFIAIEARDAAKQHIALAAMIGLIEMLRSEIEDGDDDEQ